MTPLYYITGVFVAAALGWASWFVVLNKMSPFISGTLALSLFYASLFMALTGTFALIGYYLRLAISQKKDKVTLHLNTALRQGALLSFMLCVGLSFQRLRVLTWWDAALLLIIVVLLEYYFMGRE